MIRTRMGIIVLAAAALPSGCEPGGQAEPVAFAGVHLNGAPEPTDATWQATITRRIRWGSGIDVMVAPFPDGERMAATDWQTGDVAIYSLEAGTLERLTHQPAPFADGVAMFPMVSPDGMRIAYSWQDYRNNLTAIELRVIDAEGGAPERLYRGPATAWINAMDWSRDGSQVLVLRMRDDGVYEIATVSTADGAATVVKKLDSRYPTQVRFSPDRRFIAYDYPAAADSDDRDVYVMAADGSSETVLVQGPANDQLLGWAPDGQTVLFLSDRAGTPGAWLVPVDGGRATGEPYLVKPDMWNTEPIGFDRAGRYFYGVGVGSAAMYEATLSPDGRSILGEPVDLSSRSHREVQHPRWSPDGRHIAFATAQEARPPALRIRSVDTGEEREVRLDQRITYYRDLEWLPDGRSIIAVARDNDQKWQLVKIDVRTGEVTVLLDPDAFELISGVTASPDGSTLYYTRRQIAQTVAAGSERIMAYDMATGVQHTIFEGPPARPIRRLTISPDGQTLAFTHGVVSQDPRIAVMPLGTGTPRDVAEGLVSSIAWTPDGRALLLTQPVDSVVQVGAAFRLGRLDLATGDITALGLEQEGLGAVGRPTFHPDGRRVLFRAGLPEMEWWVMEGFLGGSAAPGTPDAP